MQLCLVKTSEKSLTTRCLEIDNYADCIYWIEISEIVIRTMVYKVQKRNRYPYHVCQKQEHHVRRGRSPIARRKETPYCSRSRCAEMGRKEWGRGVFEQV